MTEQVQVKKIEESMTISDIVKDYPATIEVLLAEGIHCVGCGVSTIETIGQGLRGHGLSEEKVSQIMEDLNQAASDSDATAQGTKETLIITEKAAEKLKQILKTQNKEDQGLRISIIPGGCSGSQYDLNITEKRDEDVTLKEYGVNFYLDKNSEKKLLGSKLDYIDTLQGAGFKISNPNVSSCGCGSSFG